jgi:pimeloyl-ACP methyl ester carboxylesterase
MEMPMPRSRFRPLLPALALGVTLVLGVASAAAVSIPVGAIFRTDSLAQVAVPVGVVRAGADRLTPNAFHADRLLRHCGACTPLTVMAGAGHMDAMSPWPSSVAQAVAERHPVGGRPESGFDPAERAAAQAAIVQHFVRHLAP